VSATQADAYAPLAGVMPTKPAWPHLNGGLLLSMYDFLSSTQFLFFFFFLTKHTVSFLRCEEENKKGITNSVYVSLRTDGY
jgi:hypothetical protein